MQVTNVNPYGAVDVPLLGRTVDAGETVTVTDDQAAALLPQAINWTPADDDAAALLAELLKEN